MAILLTPARTARLFAAVAVQQQAFPSQQHPVPLPHCPACRRRPHQFILKADGTSLDFIGCGHAFALTREALLAGLEAQRAV
ncbi:hypothetical protein [Streptomyces sp. IB201691-2A2]|uniref:hypothetical protein n=1 Tax=Streptomyces sp. IB201691-2A2 TaxID=2561920 RepID=UPI00117CBA58|nr:hypothetical protein [Streptomyces sp. IB201691-2A2]TRO58545.1 hypothetical protein E4K73_38485 [Streptomyces sp. IB201691-2A2]